MREYEMNPETEQTEYGTGPTRPPKKRGGMIALILCGSILLVGIIGVSQMWFRDRLETEPEETEQMHLSGTAYEIYDPDAATEQLDMVTSPLSVENMPAKDGLSLQEIYEKAAPSVVSISCQLKNGKSSGTGVVFSENGYVVTNYHVVNSALQIRIRFHDDKEEVATLIGKDEATDLCVLRVERKDLIPAEFGDSAVLRVGDPVVAIGDPLGVELRGTMTDGIVSAINRDVVTEGRAMTLIQTNAALNAGNSGGPLINCYGQVIGINTMKVGDYMSAYGVEGLGFAIPSTTVKQVVDQLMKQGFVSDRPVLGFTVRELSRLDRILYRVPKGVYIVSVEAGSEAERSGVTVGDILLQVDDTTIADSQDLKTVLYAYRAGETVKLTLVRDGKQITVNVVLEETKG